MARVFAVMRPQDGSNDVEHILGIYTTIEKAQARLDEYVADEDGAADEVVIESYELDA